MSVIGVDVGGTKIAAGTMINGKLIDVIEIPIHAKKPAKHIFEQICYTIDLLNNSKISAICVGFPGVVHPKTGAVQFATNLPKFNNVPLKKWLLKKYKKRVFVQNDAKCFALGQLASNKSEKNIIGLILGTGVGAGIIQNRKIMTGKDGHLGEVGEWISSTGKNFENLLSGHDFVKQYHTPGLKMYEKASHGSLWAKKSFISYGTYLAELIAIMAVTFAPQRIILGGSVSKSAKFFLPTTKKELSKLKLSSKIKLPKLVIASTKYAGVIGACALADMKK